MKGVFAIAILLTVVGASFVNAQSQSLLPPPPSPAVVKDRNIWWYWDGSNWLGPYNNPEEAFRVEDSVKRSYLSPQSQPASKQKPVKALMIGRGSIGPRTEKIAKLIDKGYAIELVFVNVDKCVLKREGLGNGYYECEEEGGKITKVPASSSIGMLIKEGKKREPGMGLLYIDKNRDGNYQKSEIIRENADGLQKIFEDLGLRAGTVTPMPTKVPSYSTQPAPSIRPTKPGGTVPTLPPWTPPPSLSTTDITQLHEKFNKMMATQPTRVALKNIKEELEKSKEQFLISLKKFNQAYDIRRKELDVLDDVMNILTVTQEQVEQSHKNISKLKEERVARLRPHFNAFLELLWDLEIITESQYEHEYEK